MRTSVVTSSKNISVRKSPALGSWSALKAYSQSFQSRSDEATTDKAEPGFPFFGRQRSQHATPADARCDNTLFPSSPCVIKARRRLAITCFRRGMARFRAFSRTPLPLLCLSFAGSLVVARQRVGVGSAQIRRGIAPNSRQVNWLSASGANSTRRA
jgi:hypothetical protein